MFGGNVCGYGGMGGGNRPMQTIVPLSCITTPSPARAWPHSLTIWSSGVSFGL